VANIHIARHVDIDGIRREPGDSPNGDLYTQTVENARLLVRTLEVAMQSLYDDGSYLLTTTQTTRLPEKGRSWQDNDFCDLIDKLIIALRANLSIVQHNIEALLSIGHDQADMAQGDYNGSIEWRMSRLSVIDTRFGGAFRPMPTLNPYDRQGDDVVDMELALQKPEMKTQASVDSSTIYHNDSVASLPTLSERTQASDAARLRQLRVQIRPCSPWCLFIRRLI
jgi:son of sevenless-like protein